MSSGKLAERFTRPAHYAVQPNQYESELAAVMSVVIAQQPDECADIIAQALSSHRSRIASLYLSVFPTGTEPDEILRATTAFARDLVQPACPTLSDDPRGALIARLQREKFEIEQAYRRTAEQLEALQKQQS